MNVDDRGQEVLHNVGWGKKETQFHGRAGKEAAKATYSVPSSEALSTTDDLQPRLSWRGDGNYFVSSVVDPIRNMRVIRTYNRDGALLNTSEFVAQLEHPLAWRPSGNLIAATQMLPHRHDVVFFERNCLRHGEFSLKSRDDRVKELAWNCDSSILSVWIERNQSYIVQLWTVRNYHWYLKQELNPSNVVASLCWDSEQPLRLHILFENTHYKRYEFLWDVSVTTSLSPENDSVVAVVDGDNVLLTPFKHKNVPPPMSFASISLSRPAKHISFSPNPIFNELCVLDRENNVQFWKDIHSASPRSNALITIGQDYSTPRQIAWTSPSTLVAIEHDERACHDNIVVYEFAEGDKSEFIRDPAVVSAKGKEIIRVYHSAELDVTVVQTAVGAIYRLVKDGNNYCLVHEAEFPSACPSFSAVAMGANHKTAWIGLNDRNNLFINDAVITKECTSFFVHTEFLIVTTLSHSVHFILLAINIDELQISNDWLLNGFDEKARAVERGSRIITALPCGINLVLQMPRGNLETIAPRALVLSTVRRAIDDKDYISAFISCRKHRIDMNILVDHNPQQFKELISDFIRQVADPEYLNLFISDLRDEDVTKSTYRTTPLAPNDTHVAVGKVNMLCELLSTVLGSSDATKYIQPILTTDARKNPPALEDAMRRILAVREHQSSDDADQALKYLIFLVDVDKLYDIALGLYDFQMVLMVAQHSQKDPRDYLPFLTALQKMNTYTQRYTIDDHLNRHVSALRNLSLSPDKDLSDVRVYMKQHNLFKTGMTLYACDSEEHRYILLDYAEHQESLGAFDEAGVLYELANHLSKALQAYSDATKWRDAFRVASMLGLSKTEVKSLAEVLVESLVEKHDFEYATRISLDYLKNAQLAMEISLKGFLWNDALLIAQQNDLSSKRDDLIKPAILEAAKLYEEEICGLLQSFETQRCRLIDVLHRLKDRREHRLSNLNNDEIQLDNIDMFSDTASMVTSCATSSVRTGGTSIISSRTAKTSRQKRKMAKKRAAGKDAAFEDEFLRISIRKMVLRSNILQKEISSIIYALFVINEICIAKSLQKALKELLSLIAKSLDEIFDNQIAEKQEEYIDEEIPKKVIVETPQMLTEMWHIDALDD